VDVVLISFHFVHRLSFRGIIHTTIFSNTIFSLSEEGQLPDIFQYAKQLVIALFLVYMAKKERVYAAWAAIFGYLLIDDIFMIHERIGQFLGNLIGDIEGIEISEVAQSGYLVFLGIVLFGTALLIILRTQGETREVSIYLTVLLAVAAFFGVIVDIVQGVVMSMFGISGIVKIIEDGGEMLVMSVILWFVYRLVFETIPHVELGHILPRRRQRA
jgi:hypothetical protein